MNNCLSMKFLAISENEQLARIAVSSFILPLNPNVGDLGDIKIAVSEAVTNAVVHAYPDTTGEIVLNANYSGNDLYIEIIDEGIGIENIEEATTPSFTSTEEGHAGMGFTLMKTLMDEFEVKSERNKGTTVLLRKKIISKP